MFTNSFFEPKRFWLLVRNGFVEDYKIRWVELAVIAALVPVLSLVGMGGASTGSMGLIRYEFPVTTFFFIAYFFVGLGYAANCLNRIFHGTDNGFSFTLIPASFFEKYLSRLLISTIAWVVIVFGLFGVGFCAAQLLNMGMMGRTFSLPYTWFTDVLGMSAHFLIIQSLFFFAGMVFKKQPIGKMIGMVILFFIVVAIFGNAVLFAAIRQGTDAGNPNAVLAFLTNAFTNGSDTLQIALKVFYYGILAPVFWFITYKLMQKTQS